MNHFKHHPLTVQYQDLYPASSSREEFIDKTNREFIDNTGKDFNYDNPVVTSTTPPVNRKYKAPTLKFAPSSSESDSEYEEETIEIPQGLPYLTPPQENDAEIQPVDNNPSSPDAAVNNLPEEPGTAFHLRQPSFHDNDHLQRNDIVILVKDGYWQRARLISHAGKKSLQHGSLYWNLSGVDDSWNMGCYLFQGQSWGVLRGPDLDIDFSNATFFYPDLPQQQEEDEFEEEVA